MMMVLMSDESDGQRSMAKDHSYALSTRFAMRGVCLDALSNGIVQNRIFKAVVGMQS